MAADSRPDLWFAFADPIEVPWGSYIAQSLIDRAWGWLWAALGLTLLAALRPDAAYRMNEISRRGFMQRAVCAAAGTTLTGLSSAFASGQGPRGSQEVVSEFPYGAVQLTGGPIKRHFRSHPHYLALDNDRLLKVFRERAGLPAPGPTWAGVRH